MVRWIFSAPDGPYMGGIALDIDGLLSSNVGRNANSRSRSLGLRPTRHNRPNPARFAAARPPAPTCRRYRALAGQIRPGQAGSVRKRPREAYSRFMNQMRVWPGG